MKKNQRQIYQVLANEVDFCLCSFCRYSDSSGIDCCCDGELECLHPLSNQAVFEEEIDEAMNMGDCWGFRPSHPVAFVADVVGIILAKGWSGGASWWQDKEGEWKVAGLEV